MKYNKNEFPFSLCVLALCVTAYAAWGMLPPWLRNFPLFIQMSALLSYPAGILTFIIVFALLAFFPGRLFCKILCPAGCVQETFSRIGAKLRLRRLRYVSTPSKAFLLVIIGTATIFGFRFLAQLTDPLGLFGRLAMPLVQTWRYLINGEGTLPAPGQTLTWAVMIAGALLLTVLPLFRGRIFCDRLCPVGAMLGVVPWARRGRQKNQIVAINRDKCVSCGQCAAVCPVQCADPAGKTIVAERCLECAQCARVCKFDAIERQSRNITPKNRRSFLTGLGAAGVFFLSRPLSGFSTLFAGDSPTPQITPPGTGGDTPHRQHCIGCQACIPSCPMQIIQLNDNSALRPVLNYDLGFCHYNCRACLDSCPAHAFDDNLTLEQRQKIRVARVTLDLPHCVVLLNNTGCGACAEVCPTHALQMTAQKDADGAPAPTKPTIPDFDPSYCIGCGACYHACPAEPRAFIVQGLAKHEQSEGIRPSLAPESESPAFTLPDPDDFTDFPF